MIRNLVWSVRAHALSHRREVGLTLAIVVTLVAIADLPPASLAGRSLGAFPARVLVNSAQGA